MMKLGKNSLLTAFMILGAVCASADTVSVPGGTAAWQTWSVSQLNQNGSPYFDNWSADGSKENVGYCLTGTGNCSIKNAPGAIPYLGNANGTADSRFFFNNTSGKSSASMQVQIAGDILNETFGWYDETNPGLLHPILSGSIKGGATFAFTPSAQYGFYLTNATPGVNETFYTDSSLNLSPDQSTQHFALFEQNASTYYLGIEDLPKSQSDMDYNDMVLKVSAATPEPGSIALLGGGLLSLGALGLRRRRAAAPTAE